MPATDYPKAKTPTLSPIHKQISKPLKIQQHFDFAPLNVNKHSLTTTDENLSLVAAQQALQKHEHPDSSQIQDILSSRSDERAKQTSDTPPGMQKFNDVSEKLGTLKGLRDELFLYQDLLREKGASSRRSDVSQSQ